MIYVTMLQERHRGMFMCRLAADSDADLRTQAQSMGIDLAEHRYPGTPHSHFEIITEQREAALEAGAEEMDDLAWQMRVSQ